MLLNDKTALITGAATGIGEAVARLFASEGARVFLLDRDAARNRAVAESIRAAGGWAQDFAGDVRHAKEIAPAVAAAIQQFGQIDILINNAGIYPRQPFLGMAEEQLPPSKIVWCKVGGSNELSRICRSFEVGPGEPPQIGKRDAQDARGLQPFVYA